MTFRVTQLPWIEHPYRLISWLDMLEFSAQKYFNWMHWLGALQVMDKGDDNSAPLIETDLERVVREAARKANQENFFMMLKARVGHGIPYAEGLGLKQTAGYLARLKERFADKDFNHTKADFGRILTEIADLFASEMKGHLFFWISEEGAAAFNHGDLYFGGAVKEKFPSCAFDVSECGKCFALGRFNASVMHAMRVLESGLTAIGKAIGKNRGKQGWGPDLGEFKKQWGKIMDGGITFTMEGGNDAWKQFFAEAFSDFRHFADAWRNDAIHHPNVEYDEPEAAGIIARAKSFMAHLATRLSESAP